MFNVPNIELPPSFNGQAVPDSTDLAIMAAGTQGTGIISPTTGVVTAGASGLLLNTAACVVAVNGVSYSVAATTGSLSCAAALTNQDRRDLVVYTVGTGLVVVEGAGNGTANFPVKPAIPANSVALSEVYVSSTTGTLSSPSGPNSGNFTDKSYVIGNPSQVVAKTANYSFASGDSPSFFTFNGVNAFATTIAAGSNAVNVNTFTGAGVLNVASNGTTGFSSAGTISVAYSGGTCTISYTGTSGSNSFTGCTTLGGVSGTLSTNGAVAQSQPLVATLLSSAPSDGWHVRLMNLNSTPVQLNGNGLTINGSASPVYLSNLQVMDVWCDGSNYFAGFGSPQVGSVVTAEGTASASLSTNTNNFVAGLPLGVGVWLVIASVSVLGVSNQRQVRGNIVFGSATGSLGLGSAWYMTPTGNTADVTSGYGLAILTVSTAGTVVSTINPATAVTGTLVTGPANSLVIMGVRLA